MIDYDRLRKAAYDLQIYAELEGTEIGETCMALITISHFTDYVSEEFAQALLTEIEEHLSTFQQDARIVEHEETITRKVSYIEWG